MQRKENRRTHWTYWRCGFNRRVTSHHFDQTWQTAASLPLMDTSSTTLFETYEQDFNQLIESTRDKLEGSGKDEVGGASVHPITPSLC